MFAIPSTYFVKHWITYFGIFWCPDIFDTLA